MNCWTLRSCRTCSSQVPFQSHSQRAQQHGKYVRYANTLCSSTEVSQGETLQRFGVESSRICDITQLRNSRQKWISSIFPLWVNSAWNSQVNPGLVSVFAVGFDIWPNRLDDGSSVLWRQFNLTICQVSRIALSKVQDYELGKSLIWNAEKYISVPLKSTEYQAELSTYTRVYVPCVPHFTILKNGFSKKS